MSDLKIAFIGLGAVANAHLHAFNRLKGAIISSAVEPREARRTEVSQAFGIPVFPSVPAMLADGVPDIACILTPCVTHRPITEELCEAGVNVFCEKPIAATMADALAMKKACDTAKVAFQYGSSYRFLPAVVKARQLIAGGAIGSIRFMSESVITGHGISAYEPKTMDHYAVGGPGGGGLGLVDHGIHLLDIMPWLADSPIKKVLGRGDISGEAPVPEFALLALENGAIVSLAYDQSTWSSDMPWEGIFSSGRNGLPSIDATHDNGFWDHGAGSIRVHGTQGALRIFHYANKLYLFNEDGQHEILSKEGAAPAHFITQLQTFVDHVNDDQVDCPGFDVALSALASLLALYDSASEQRWVEL